MELEQATTPAPPPGVAGRFVAWWARGVKWYGAEWYITLIGAAILVVILFVTLASPILAPYDPIAESGPAFEAPNMAHWMGTDNLGRDVFSRILYGARVVLLLAFTSAIFALILGLPLGLISGFAGGKTDRALSLVMDSVYSFPGLLLAIAMVAVMGPQSQKIIKSSVQSLGLDISGDALVVVSAAMSIAVAIAIVYVPTYFRMVRGQVLAVKQELYVEAARSLGARSWTILWQYIFPNVIPSIVVVFSLNVADAILTEAGLSFLGLGLPPPTPDWGVDLNRGKAFLPQGRWWMITFPGLMIVFVTLGFSMLGEGLNEILNPRLTDS
ncbi:MAG: ABC transporter permease [Chloroflexi bacterium]|nr:ABC transporter permease [Chloroflexota bacterium]